MKQTLWNTSLSSKSKTKFLLHRSSSPYDFFRFFFFVLRGELAMFHYLATSINNFFFLSFFFFPSFLDLLNNRANFPQNIKIFHKLDKKKNVRNTQIDLIFIRKLSKLSFLDSPGLSYLSFFFFFFFPYFFVKCNRIPFFFFLEEYSEIKYFYKWQSMS